MRHLSQGVFMLLRKELHMSTTSNASRSPKSPRAAVVAKTVTPCPSAPTRPTTELRRRMQQDRQLAGLSQGTQQAYLRTVRQLAAHFNTPPDQVSEAQLREYLLFLKNDKQLAPATLRLAYS